MERRSAFTPVPPRQQIRDRFLTSTKLQSTLLAPDIDKLGYMLGSLVSSLSSDEGLYFIAFLNYKIATCNISLFKVMKG